MSECGFDRRIPDSPLDDFIGKCSGDAVAALRRQLHAQVHTDWRSKSLKPVGLPGGVGAVDHTTLWTGPVAHAHAPHAQVVHQKERPAYAQVRAGRTVWRSAVSKPAIDQVASRASTQEGGMLPEVFQVLEATYGVLIEIYSLDARCCSPAKAPRIAAAPKGDILGLKSHQPEWRREAERVLGAQTTPEERRAWAPDQGDQLRSHLSRPTAMAASRDGSHLQQGWRREQERRQGKTGPGACEHRDDVTNRHRGRLRPEPILAVVSAHWALENHGNWTVDGIWDADSKVWGGQGVGMQVRGLWRLMASNVVARRRCRALCMREQRRAEKRRGQAWCDALLLLICQTGRTLFPHRPAIAGL